MAHFSAIQVTVCYHKKLGYTCILASIILSRTIDHVHVVSRYIFPLINYVHSFLLTACLGCTALTQYTLKKAVHQILIWVNKIHIYVNRLSRRDGVDLVLFGVGSGKSREHNGSPSEGL